MFHQTDEVEATTLWELWNSPTGSPSMDSRNHIMFGSIGAWFYHTLAGIKRASPLRTVLISPPSFQVLQTAPFSFVSGSIETNFGTLSSSWRRVGGTQCLQISRIRSKFEFDNAAYLSQCGKGYVHVDCGSGTIAAVSAHSSCASELHYQSDALDQCRGKSDCCISVNSLLAKMGPNGEVDPTTSAFVKYNCLGVTASYQMNVTIPVTNQAELHVSTLSLANPTIYENGAVVWANGAFRLGPAGIQTGWLIDSATVGFVVHSGDYKFKAVPGS
jgi:hypothetical protein